MTPAYEREPGWFPLIAGRFARGPGPESLHNVGVGLGLGRRSLSGVWMGIY